MKRASRSVAWALARLGRLRLTAIVMLLAIAALGWQLYEAKRELLRTDSAAEQQVYGLERIEMLERTAALARSKQAIAQAVAASSPIYSLLLALEAVRAATEADAGLDEALAALDDAVATVGAPVLGVQTGPVSSLAWDPLGRWVASGTDHGSVRLMPVPSRGQASLAPAIELEGFRGDPVSQVAFAPDGSTLAVRWASGALRAWDTTGSPDARPVSLEAWSHDHATALAFLPSAGIVVGTQEGVVLVRRAGTPELVVGALGDAVSVVAVGGGGRHLMAAHADGRVDSWALTDGSAHRLASWFAAAPLVRLHGPNSTGEWLGIDRSGRLVRLRKLEDESDSAPADALHVEAVAHEAGASVAGLTDDGELVLVRRADGILQLSSSGRPPEATIELPGSGAATAVSLMSGDGRRVVAGMPSGVLQLWRLNRNGTGFAVGPWALSGHDRPVTAAAFGPSGNLLATGDASGVVRAWHLEGVSEAASAQEPGASAGRVQVLDWRGEPGRLPADELVEAACALAGRNMSLSEWQAFAPESAYRTTCDRWAPNDRTRVPPPTDESPALVVQRIFAAEAAPEGRADAPSENRVDRLRAAVEDAVQALLGPPSWPMSASEWNLLCWEGALAGFANEVLPICERAVELAPGDGNVRDSRGVALAVAGRPQAAIEDFRAYVVWARGRVPDRLVTKREAWIAALIAGEDPFGPSALADLRDE